MTYLNTKRKQEEKKQKFGYQKAIATLFVDNMKSLNRFMIWEIKSGHLFMCGCGLCACSFIWIISVQHGFYFSVYSFIPRWLPIQLVRFCLFVWDVVICFIYLAVFFFGNWWMVRYTRTFVPGQCEYVQLIQIEEKKKNPNAFIIRFIFYSFSIYTNATMR